MAMGAGDAPQDASEVELWCARLLKQAMQLGLGFSEPQLSCAIKHYLKIFEGSKDAVNCIQQDNFSVVVDYILENQEMENVDQRKIETITLSGDSEKTKDQTHTKVSTNELSDDSFDSGVKKAGRLDRNAMHSFYKTKMNKTVNDTLQPKANAFKSSIDEKSNCKSGFVSSGLNMAKHSPTVHANTIKNGVHEQLNTKAGHSHIAPDSVISRQPPKNVFKNPHDQSNTQSGHFQSSTVKNRQSCSTNTCTTTEIIQCKAHQNGEMKGYNNISVPLRLKSSAVSTQSTETASSFLKDNHGSAKNVGETSTCKAADIPSSSRNTLAETSISKVVEFSSSARTVVDGSSSKAIVGEASTRRASDGPSSSNAAGGEASFCKASDVPSSSRAIKREASPSKPTGVPSSSRILELEAYLKEGKCEMALKSFLSWKEEGFKVQSTPDNDEELSNIPGKKKGFILSLDITRGLEKLPISCVNEYNEHMLPEDFLYITRSVIRSGAHVDTSFSRIGDLHCSCDDCLRSPERCKCNDSTRGECAYDSDGRLISRLASSFQSLNFATESGDFITECCDKCRCTITCGNRVVQRGITRKLQVFMTPKKGWGVRALEKIPARSFIFEYIGEIATNEEQYYRNMEYKKNGVYTYTMNLDADYDMEEKHFREGLTDSELLVLDATMYGNVARFVNHRCEDANMFMRPVQIESRDTHYYHAAYFAVRDIEEMEELTWDYGIDFNDTSHEVKAFMCHCKSPYCRDSRKKRKVVKTKAGTKKAKLDTLVP